MSTALATTQQNTTPVKRTLTPVEQIKTLINSDKFKAELASCVPQHVRIDVQARLLCNVLSKNPKLADCTQVSLFQCMLDCSAMGLVPDNRRAHLIPYGTNCTLIIDYKGLVELVMRSGEVEFIDAFCVYANDEFSLTYGLNPDIQHKPCLSEDRGDLTGVYGVAKLKGLDKPKFSYLPKSEVEKVRKSSKAGNSGPWTQWYDEMAKKTAIRRLCKLLPLSYETAEMLEREVRTEHEDARFKAARPVVTDNGPVPFAQLAAPAPATEATPIETETQVIQPQDDPDEVAAGLAPEPPAPVQQAPQAPAKPATTQTETAAPGTPLDQLRKLMAANQVSEPQICKWVINKFRFASLGSLKELAESSPKRVIQIVTGWNALVAEIKATAI
jgi:recombination protein RecT